MKLLKIKSQRCIANYSNLIFVFLSWFDFFPPYFEKSSNAHKGFVFNEKARIFSVPVFNYTKNY